MRRFNALAILMGLLTFAVFAGAGAAPAAAADLAGGPILNVGHRGSTGLAPEHTIASYDLALEDGADYIEQDLRMTSDGVLVVLHDEDLDRTTRGAAENCTGPVSEKTLAQVKTCDVGSFFNERYPEYARDEYEGLKIPTLEEVFQRYGTETNYYIETRSSEAPLGNPGIDDSSGMEEESLRLMDEYGLRDPAAGSWRVLIQSFVPASLSEIHAQDPSLPLVQLYSDEETKKLYRRTSKRPGPTRSGSAPRWTTWTAISSSRRTRVAWPYIPTPLRRSPICETWSGSGWTACSRTSQTAWRLCSVRRPWMATSRPGRPPTPRGLADPGLERRCRTPAGSLLLPTSFGALLLSLGLLAVVLRRV